MSAESQPLIRVVDDDASFRAAILRLLRAGGFAARGYASGEEFLKEPPVEAPGCILLDVRMPGLNGLELQKAIADSENPLPIIFLTGHGEIPMSVQAIKSGATDFLSKPIQRETLFAAIAEALNRDSSDRVRRSRMRELSGRYESLTAREKEVFWLVVSGKLNKQIADDIGTVERTVKAHRGKVMEKMRVDSVAELVRLAQELERYAPPTTPAH